MSNNITVIVDARHLDVGKNATMTKEEAVDAAREMVEKIAEMYKSAGAQSAEISFKTEGGDRDPVQKVRVKLVLDKHVIIKAAHARSISKAIDRVKSDLTRQVRRLKEKKTTGRKASRKAHAAIRRSAARRSAMDNGIDIAD